MTTLSIKDIYPDFIGNASSNWVTQAPATTAITLTVNRTKIQCDTSGGAFTVTFPPAASSGDTAVKLIDAFKTDSTSTTQGWGFHNLTVAAPSGYTVEGGATFLLNRSSISPEFCLDAGTTNWYIDGGIV